MTTFAECAAGNSQLEHGPDGADSELNDPITKEPR
jgi:hypothetical protein